MKITKAHEPHIEAIVSELKCGVIVKIECPVCGEENQVEVEEATDNWMKDAAVQLLRSGWRHGVNNEHQVQGVLCETCYQGDV